ncbi:MAG: hypothetical protein QXK93_02000 [Candidatus Bathyarchaeia archaeon]|nr:hypothetical protein [Candidatus Bathyarchaeota archaeon]
MKRWMILLGRCGTTIIAIGLALFLVSLIPQATVRSFSGSGDLQAKTWRTYYQSVLTPQNSLNIKIKANNTIRAYLLEVSFQTIYDWINKIHPQIPGTDPLQIFNQTLLTEFLEANPQTIAIEKEVVNNRETMLEYMPTKIANVTLILCNPNVVRVQVNYEGSEFLNVAPKAKLQTVSEIITPIGAILTVPWIARSFKERKKHNFAN